VQFRPELRVLSEEQVYDIRQAALDILWNTGVLVKAPAARALLRQAGAWIDEQTMLCRIPGYIIEEALNRAPSSFTLYARNPAHNVHVSTRSLHYEPMIGRLNCYDYATGTSHRTTLEEVEQLVKLADALPSYHLLHSGAIMPQIAHSYDIPCRGTASATDSKLLDIQAGYEKATVLTMAALGGVNKIFYPGTMEGALTVSKEGLVIDDEIIQGLYRVLEGIDVNDATLALDVIDRVGPSGHFLGQRHTMQFLEREQFIPSLSDRLTRANWEQAGSKDVAEQAHERVEEILAQHTVDPLDSKVEAELERIVLEVEEREAKRGH